LSATALSELLAPSRLTEVVDIGANPMGEPPPYTMMLSAGLCSLTGFEPHPGALRALKENQRPGERYLPYAVGAGGEQTFFICKSSDMSSFLEPDPVNLALFDALRPTAEVVERAPMRTHRLDDIEEVARVDFLKMDVQGSELAILRGGRAKLAGAVAIQAEVSFITIYREQPPFGEIDMELRQQGFIPHCYRAVKLWPIAPCIVNNNPYQPVNQLLEADIVYTRDFARPDEVSDEQLKQLALIAHHIYGSVDLALRCIMLLEKRDVLAGGSQQRYLQIAHTAGRSV
jgi:FkbM family methyltransferase